MSKYPSRSDTPTRPGTHSVLIVDDDPDVLESFTQILETRGYKVDSAETGREFLERAKINDYDVAIVDLRLPDMEGTEVLSNMRRISPKTKKIVITGYPTLESAIDAMGSGTDAYLLKPLEPEDFLRVVEEKMREKDEAETRIMEEIRTRAGEVHSRGNIPRVRRK